MQSALVGPEADHEEPDAQGDGRQKISKVSGHRPSEPNLGAVAPDYVETEGPLTDSGGPNSDCPSEIDQVHHPTEQVTAGKPGRRPEILAGKLACVRFGAGPVIGK